MASTTSIVNCRNIFLQCALALCVTPIVYHIAWADPVPTPKQTKQLSPAAVYTQRYNNRRTGANLQEHILTVEALKSGEFQQLYKIPVKGQVYAQPLLVPRVKWPDATIRNVLIVATMKNEVSAFQVDDPLSGPAFAPICLWTIKLGEPVAGSFMPMASSAVGLCAAGFCWPGDDAPPTAPPLPPVGTSPTPWNRYGYYNINPFIGVVSTPVVDQNTLILYLVSKLVSDNGAVNRLFAIDLVKGKISSSVDIGNDIKIPGTSSDSQGGQLAFSTKLHMQRPALLLQNGQLYVAFGSHQDTRPWHGWIFSYDSKTLQRTSVWCSTPNGMGGSIWQAGGGIAGDDSAVYVMTGNGDEDPDESNHWDSTNDVLGNFGEHFVQLDPGLRVIGRFAPSNALQMDRADEDADLGSSGPVLFPEPRYGNILFGGGKDSRLFVLDSSTHLSVRQFFQAGARPDSLTANKALKYHHIHGSPILWRSSKNGMNLYVWPERDRLRKFHWNDDTAVLECKTRAGIQEKCQDGDAPIQTSTIKTPTCLALPLVGCWSMPGGILSLSADGDTPGTGILWASMPKKADALYNIVPGELRAFDADDIAQELWNSGTIEARDGNFYFAKYTPPVIANGRAYMATFSDFIGVYGLKQWARYLAESVPQRVKVGETFKTQVTFLNAGTTVWKLGTFRLGAHSSQGQVNWGTDHFALPADVNSGDQITIDLTLKAPNNPSTTPGCKPQVGGSGYVCEYQWQMADGDLKWFGEFTPSVQILVVMSQ
jgi:hypothetical protein